MSPPLPPAPDRQVSLFDCLTCLSVGMGAVAGAIWGGWKYGWLGAVLGLPAGAVLGPFALAVGWVVGWVVGLVTVVPLVFLFNEGPRGVWEFIRGRWVPPNERPGANQTNESGG